MLDNPGLIPEYLKACKYGAILLMAQIKDIIKTVAPTGANVLIMGENGTGKELAAWALHKESLRREDAIQKLKEYGY